jgi:hypothetical protein
MILAGALSMSIRTSLVQLLETLPEERQREVLDFAEFLCWQDDRSGWQRFGRAHLARAYDANEPEYSLDDLIPRPTE